MLQIVYGSSAVRPFAKTELVELLTQARAKNSRLGITGMLLYKDGNFLQVIEGDDNAVRQLFGSILQDVRHQDILVIDENTVSERQFGNWSMAFRNLGDKEVSAIPGFSQFMNVGLKAGELKADPTGCWALLKLFRNNM